MRYCAIALVIGLAGAPAELDAETIRLSPESRWFEVLHGGGLKPGDEVMLAAGTYRDARRLELNHRGTKEKPIVIRARGARLARPDARQNSINMAGCQWLEIHGLEITGGSAGIRIGKTGEFQPKFLRFEGLHIHHIGGVAITANHEGTTYEGLVFHRNHIHHTGGHGEAFYLGCNNREDGSTPGYVFNSVVSNNYIHHLNGPGVSQGDGIELKDGSYGNLVCDNVIHDTGYPGVIVYGTDGKPPNIIERNVIWNAGDHGIQAAAEAVIRNNIIFGSKGSGIYARNHQSAVVGKLEILHNTVVTKGPPALRFILPDGGGIGPVLVANNALYAATAIATNGPLELVGNAGSGRVSGMSPGPHEWQGGGERAADFGSGRMNFFPSRGSHLIGKASGRRVQHDFNGTARRGSKDCGAYRHDPAGNPGWPLAPGFKDGP